MKVDNSANEISTKAARSLVLLISRTGFLQVFSLIGIFFLTQYLTPMEFGIFFLVNELVGILGYFSDVGLSASLIQQRLAPTLRDLRTSFTIQQLLFGVLCLLGLAISPLLARFYQWESTALWLWVAVLLGFLLASLKTIPSVLIERSLKFEKLVIVETVETILFYSVAVYFAIQGWGLTSYALAVLVRGISGLVIIYLISPWPIGFAWDKSSISKLLKFGVPYQLNTIIAAIKDRLLNVILGGVVGAHGLGLLGWAQTWSQKPLRFVSDNVTRVTFPALSQLQDNPDRLKSAITKMLFFSSVVVFPFVIGSGVILSPLIELIPRYDKWQPAVPLFYLYALNSLWAAISTPATNALAAIGHIKTVTKLMIMWTILTWGVVAPLAWLYGYQGVAYGVGIISFASVVPLMILRRYVRYSVKDSLLPPLISSSLMALVGISLVQSLTPSWGMIALTIMVSALVYSVLIKLLAPRLVQDLFTKLTKSLWPA